LANRLVVLLGSESGGTEADNDTHDMNLRDRVANEIRRAREATRRSVQIIPAQRCGGGSVLSDTVVFIEGEAVPGSEGGPTTRADVDVPPAHKQHARKQGRDVTTVV
jgi:hypothetical protein